jgi:hypothetical protein
VSQVRDEHKRLVIHNIPGTPYDADMPVLEAFARSQMKGPLEQADAHALIEQYQETARIRGWDLRAASATTYDHSGQ